MCHKWPITHGWEYVLGRGFIGRASSKRNGCNYPSSKPRTEEIERERIKCIRFGRNKVQLNLVQSILSSLIQHRGSGLNPTWF